MNERPWLNHGGTSPDNPLLEGMAVRLRLQKHDANETLRQCWVVSEGRVFKKLTPIVVETTHEMTVDIVIGEHVEATLPPKQSVIHFTTSRHRHARAFIWAAPQPAAMITLDGYNGANWQRPLIYPYYREEEA